MLPASLLTTAALELAFVVVVITADRRRWDNRWIAGVGLLDALTATLRAVAVIGGGPLDDARMVPPVLATNIVMSWLVVEFAYSFPFNRHLPWRLRAPILLVCAAAEGVALYPGLERVRLNILDSAFFLPLFLLTLALVVRNLRRLTGQHRGVGLVMFALVFRWLSGLLTFLVLRPIGGPVFELMKGFDATAAVVISFLVMGYAVLRNQLFSVRGGLAQLGLYLLLAVGLLGDAIFGVEAALRYAPNGVVLRAMLIGVALVPVAVLAVGLRYRAVVEKVLLQRIDPRRAACKDALERVMALTGDAEAMLEATRVALSDVTRGGAVRYLRLSDGSGELPAELAAHFLRATYLHRGDLEDLSPPLAAAFAATPGDLLVPVRSGETLFGVFAVTGGDLDREGLRAALTLGTHLGLKLENDALFEELSGARRLATLGAFAAAIAHDIRTPLTSVQMNVQILRRKSQLGPDDMEHFDIALEELHRLNNHITEILDYAKPVQLCEGPVELAEVVSDTARRMAPLLQARQLTLEQHHAGGLPSVLGDSERIRQVLWNLVENAAKASPDGAAIVLSTRSSSDGRLAMEVSDSGRGIDPRDLPKIFEPFFTTRPDGTGLGLAICQKLVRAHAGEIRVSSTLGRGSTFTVLLPASS